MKNGGADAQWLANRGIPVRTDLEPSYHMHDKFAVVDGEFVITGSFNWTYAAGSHNQENVCVVDAQFYTQKYTAEFNRLWGQFKST